MWESKCMQETRLVIAFKNCWILTIYLDFIYCPLLNAGFTIYMGNQLSPWLFLLFYSLCCWVLSWTLTVPSYHYQQTGVTPWIYLRNWSPIILKRKNGYFPNISTISVIFYPKSHTLYYHIAFISNAALKDPY